MVYSTGQPCTIDFQLYPEFLNVQRSLPLHPSTYGRELFDRISEHFGIPNGNFNLYLTCDAIHTIDLADAKEKTMSELGVDFSFDVDSNECPKYVLYVTNPTVTLNSLPWWFTRNASKYHLNESKHEQDQCTADRELTWAGDDGTLSSKEPECQGKEPEAFRCPDQAGRRFKTFVDEPEACDRQFFEHIVGWADEPSGYTDMDTQKNTLARSKRTCTVTSATDKWSRRPIGTESYQCAEGSLKAEGSCPKTEGSGAWLMHQENPEYKNSVEKPEGYVGLVNQAMTCYLNSLLQALYMTPEFRNALYNWEYGEGLEKDEANSIPYQLQKLFLNLQTSSRTAVETTALTKSFGWDSTEAWQQHDIQELCRVMFDALERKFANTEQADLINRLYEGKMTDYVKCLECGTEKTREDTFLDIPLPVRPFGSNIAHNSVEEALKAFVQYETLEGANQYHCDKCNKKCDAHKGLKFTKFPYLLTLHLKRFDFDYKTFHRIKLNDKVTFPDILNLNSFISTGLNQESMESKEDLNFGGKCDDSSTTDSGTINEDCAPFENSLSNSSHSINHDHEDDEGIDIYNGPSTSSCSPQAQETENNRINYDSTDGPYQYELFSILIHSGTAIGGHYYAYIKDFRTQEWLCFNDQNVTEITQDDIQKTYGGGPPRAYYSSACRSSTNAYMLMYRQIDPAQNALPMQVEEFPKHIQELLTKIKENEDNDMKNPQHRKILQVYKIQIGYRRPDSDELETYSLYKMPYITMACLTEHAYEKLYLDKTVSLDQFRLVSYDPISELIIESYEGREDELIGQIWYQQRSPIFLLMETRGKDETFQRYHRGGIITKVYIVDIYKGEIVDGPINIRAVASMSLVEYKQLLGTKLNMDPNQMQIVSYSNSSSDSKYRASKWPDCDDENLYGLGRNGVPVKIFVACVPDAESQAFFAVTSKFENVISLNVQLPDVSKEILENLNIITLEEEPKEVERPVLPKEPEKVAANNVQVTPCPVNDSSGGSNTNCDARQQEVVKRMREHLNIGDVEEESNTPEQSNSEDSSLSDSDKTLVRDPPEEDDDYLLPTQIDFHKFDIDLPIIHWNHNEKKCNVDEDGEYYFKAMPYTNNNQRWLKILVDNRIKHINFKRELERYVGVPTEYFTIYNLCDDEEPMDRLLVGFQSCLDGQKINIKLKHALRPDEFKVKLYMLKCYARPPYKYLCEWVLSQEKTVRQTKKEILEALVKNFGIIIPLHRCRLRIRYHDIPTRVLLDDQKLEQYEYCMGYDKMIAIQELPEPDPVTEPNQVVIFAKKYPFTNPGLHDCVEIVLNEQSIKEVKRKISEMSSIPVQNLEIAKGRQIPFGDVSPTDYGYDWSGSCLEGFLANGSILLYRYTHNCPPHLPNEDLELKEPDEDPLHDIADVLRGKEASRSHEPKESLVKPRRHKDLRIYRAS